MAVTAVASTPAGERRLMLMMEMLAAAHDAVMSATSPAAVMQRVCEASVEGVQLESAAVFWSDEDGGAHLAPLAVAGNGTLLAAMRPALHVPEEAMGLSARAFVTGQPHVSADLLRDDRLVAWREELARSPLRSAAALPLRDGERSLGVLLLLAARPDAFDDLAVQMLSRMADKIVAAQRMHRLESARDEQERDTRRFRVAIDMSADSIFLVERASMRYVDVNAAACRLLGYTRDELLRLSPTDLIDAPRAQVEAAYDEAIAHPDRHPQSVVTVRHRDGRRRVCELHRQAVRLDGRWYVVTVSRDVTLRQAEARRQRIEHAVTRQLSQSGSTLRILANTLREVCEISQWRSGAFFAPSPKGPRLVCGWRSEGAGESAWRPGAVVPADSMVAATIEHGRVHWTADATRDPQWRDPATPGESAAAPRARLMLPLRTEEKVLGALAFSADRIEAPDAAFEATAAVIGVQIGQFLKRKETERAIRASEERFRTLVALSSDWYWEQDEAHRFVLVESGDRTESEFTDSLVGRTLWEARGVKLSRERIAVYRQLVERGEAFRDFLFRRVTPTGEVRWTSMSGTPIRDRESRIRGWRGVARDITEQRRAHDRIHHLATHDTLTGLPNRARFSDVLREAVARCAPQAEPFAVLLLDLDRFKQVNDTLGHAAGDELLRQLSKRLQLALRSQDAVARVGGDEFAVLLRSVGSHDEAAVVARKLMSSAAQPLRLEGDDVSATVSVGVCLFPDDACDDAELLRSAETAMYRAKQDGGDAFRFFSQDISAKALRRMRIESGLKRALERGELALHFQPKVEGAAHAVIGVEALLRWNSAELGAVSPADFIPVAEETRLILPIGGWVLRRACEQAMQWRRRGIADLTMAVNLSPRQLLNERLLDELRQALAETGLPGDRLELEITEGSVVDDPDRAAEVLAQIKSLGVRLSIDDFGTGYSSLGQLKRFPIDALKIDRSFVQHIPQDEDQIALTAAIIAMARTLRLDVVAEGVETPEQELELRRQGCSQMQGFLFGRPLTAEDFERWLRSTRGEQA